MAAILLKPSAVAEALGISRSLAYQLMRQGAIPHVRLSKRAVRVRPEDLEAYIRENVTGSAVTVPTDNSQIIDRTKLGS